jgi:outer membrane receptor protein involved in Fe transport
MPILCGRRFTASLGAACALWVATCGAEELPILGGLTPLEQWVGLPDSPIRLVSQVERSTQPLESSRQPLDLEPRLADASLLGEERGSSLSSGNLRELAQLETSSPTADVVGGGQAATTAPTDLGSLLQRSDDVQTIGSQQRSPVAFDPHVRGYRFGQVYAQSAGEYFLPDRLDLDSMLSKIDPYLIQRVTVIPGPYGLRYGPGFSFIDVVPIDTPRSECGTQWNNRFSILARGNGSQIIGQDTLSGGGENYGFISNYGLRTGADYRAGNGQLIPSSFHSQSVLMQFGWDTAEGSVEARYNRYDLWDTEYALQFFDVNSMKTDSFSLNYSGVDSATDAQNTLQVWYNQTAFDGNNLKNSKREIRGRVTNGLNNDFNTQLFNPGSFQGFVAGNLVSTGARAVRTYGDEACEYARVGADVRYVTQSTSERFQIEDPGQFLRPDEENFFTNQPHSALTDPGIFAEYGRPWASYFKTAIGGRVDWANTHPRTADYDDSPLIPGINDRNFEQNDVLLAGYFTGEAELTPEWSVRGGLGYAERVPDLVNRYADGVFLGILQTPFSKVVGFPALQKERATQADVSAVADYGVVTGRASYFYSWINDYNTYTTFGVDPPTGAQVLLAQNTALATLTGFELYGDYRSSDITTYFASLQYVEGTDRAINRPLPQIYPLQSRVGVRWTDPAPDNSMGLEWGFRFVARQSRAGFLRDDLSTNPTSVAVELPTAGFFTSYLRGYYHLTSQMHLVGGVDNLFDRTYLEHLDLRLRGSAVTSNGVTSALSPGFTAYAGLEWFL